ncbi:hypothetical protein D3C72_2000330 [compost metagenome]
MRQADQAISRHTSGVTAENQRLAEVLTFGGAFDPCNRHRRNGSGSQRIRVHQAHQCAAQRSCGRHNATKHILQLAALLQQDRQRLLPALKGNDDVGHLGRNTAHGCGLLCSAYPVLVQLLAGDSGRCSRSGQLRLQLIQNRSWNTA